MIKISVPLPAPLGLWLSDYDIPVAQKSTAMYLYAKHWLQHFNLAAASQLVPNTQYNYVLVDVPDCGARQLGEQFVIGWDKPHQKSFTEGREINLTRFFYLHTAISKELSLIYEHTTTRELEVDLSDMVVRDLELVGALS